MITKTVPEIPATPGLPSGLPRRIPAFLAATGSPLEKVAAEFNRTVDKYRARAQVHSEIANQGALNTAMREDDLAHAQAVRNGDDDPGTAAVTQWQEDEETARRAVAGARDAVKMVWADLLAHLAAPDIGGKIVAEIEARRDEARQRLTDALEKLGTAMGDLDVADDQAAYARQAAKHATPGVAVHWPSGGVAGNPKPLMVNGRPEPVENMLATLARYRDAGTTP